MAAEVTGFAKQRVLAAGRWFHYSGTIVKATTGL